MPFASFFSTGWRELREKLVKMEAERNAALYALKSFCKSKAATWGKDRDPYAAGVRDAMETVCAWIDNAQAGEDVHD